jgi:hypothetical protein
MKVVGAKDCTICVLQLVITDRKEATSSIKPRKEDGFSI